MDDLFAALEGTAVAQYLRVARWGYAAVNASHIFGIALLIGATVPLSLRFLGLWPSVPRQMLVRVLAPMAATGLVLAVGAGMLLFSVKAREYADIGFLQIKLLLVVAGTLSALTLHRATGRQLEAASDRRLVGHAIFSLLCWLGALVCGRLIAFVGD